MDKLCTFAQGHLRTLEQYNVEFNGRLKPWKDDMSLRASTYLYIEGLQNGLLLADLIANWESRNYNYLIELQPYAINITMQRFVVTQQRMRIFFFALIKINTTEDQFSLFRELLLTTNIVYNNYSYNMSF